jgi:hypothetical protein
LISLAPPVFIQCRPMHPIITTKWINEGQISPSSKICTGACLKFPYFNLQRRTRLARWLDQTSPNPPNPCHQKVGGNLPHVAGRQRNRSPTRSQDLPRPPSQPPQPDPAIRQELNDGLTSTHDTALISF